jgi:hypothetical protein
LLEGEDGVASGGVAHEEAYVAGGVAVLVEGGGGPVAGRELVLLERVEARARVELAEGVRAQRRTREAETSATVARMARTSWNNLNALGMRVRIALVGAGGLDL